MILLKFYINKLAKEECCSLRGENNMSGKWHMAEKQVQNELRAQILVMGNT